MMLRAVSALQAMFLQGQSRSTELAVIWGTLSVNIFISFGSLLCAVVGKTSDISGAICAVETVKRHWIIQLFLSGTLNKTAHRLDLVQKALSVPIARMLPLHKMDLSLTTPPLSSAFAQLKLRLAPVWSSLSAPTMARRSCPAQPKLQSPILFCPVLLPNEHSDLLLHKVHCQSQPPTQRHQALLLGQSPDDNCQPVGIWHIKSVEFVANSNAQNHTSFHDTHSFQSSIFVLGHGQNITTNFEVNNVIGHITRLQSDCSATLLSGAETQPVQRLGQQ